MPILVKSIDQAGIDFVEGHEGFVSHYYLDPIKVPTIGSGFTMRNAVFSRYWRETKGHALRPGDTISRAENDAVIRMIMSKDVAPAILKHFPNGLRQNQWNAVSSVVYNLGPRALGWKWAKALKRGDVTEAARLLRSTGTTAGGKKLRGLVRRRAEEADLLSKQLYPKDNLTPDTLQKGKAERAELQGMLNMVTGSSLILDGIFGPATEDVVRRFQHTNPPLKVDGILGRATESVLRERFEKIRPGTQPKPEGALAALIRVILELFQ